ncbi:MAG: YceD family protein [Actinomycetes bacterium]
MTRLPEVYKLNTYELPHRPGEMKEYELDIEIPEKVGTELIAVAAGDTIEVDARLESVAEGILLSAEIFATARGECTRCLDPVEIAIEKKIQELYLYEKKAERKKGKPVEDDLEIEDEFLMEGDVMDLQTPIRDAIVLSLPNNPLCREDCEGLCPDCGGKWAELPDDHAHEAIDARWAGLAGLTIEEPDFKN